MSIESRLYNNSVVYLISRTESKVIYTTHSSRGTSSYEMPAEKWDSLPLYQGGAIEALGRCSKNPQAFLAVMETSKQTEYWVMLEKEGRAISLNFHLRKNRAEYEIAELNWVFNGGEKPCVMDYPDEDEHVSE